jgi:Flp pilus assembly protein TadG
LPAQPNTVGGAESGHLLRSLSCKRDRTLLPRWNAIGKKAMLRDLIVRFAKSRKANVAVIFAITIVPTIYLLGMGIDYTRARRRQSQLDAAADAAAIAAVTPSMMAQSTTVAQTTATNIFNTKVNAIAGGLTATPILTVSVTSRASLANKSGRSKARQRRARRARRISTSIFCWTTRRPWPLRRTIPISPS